MGANRKSRKSSERNGDGEERPNRSWIPLAFRYPPRRAPLLQTAHEELKEENPEQHKSLSDTIRWFVDQGLERYFRREV